MSLPFSVPKPMRIHFTSIGRVIATFLAVIALLMMGISVAQGSAFHLDYDDLQSDTSILTGGNYRLEAGLMAMPSEAIPDIMVLADFSGDSGDHNDQSNTSTTVGGAGGRRGNPPINRAQESSQGASSTPLRPAPSVEPPAVYPSTAPQGTGISSSPSQHSSATAWFESVSPPGTEQEGPVYDELTTFCLVPEPSRDCAGLRQRQSGNTSVSRDERSPVSLDIGGFHFLLRLLIAVSLGGFLLITVLLAIRFFPLLRPKKKTSHSKRS